jgi:hypothetical protein
MTRHVPPSSSATDASSVRRGMLPKDTIQKLKQIEKFSKRLRSELEPLVKGGSP